MADNNNDSVWHKCEPPLVPRRTVNGRWTISMGQTWRRRKTDGRWEYRQNDETEEQYLDRQL
jgi:hypothetical protein